MPDLLPIEPAPPPGAGDLHLLGPDTTALLRTLLDMVPARVVVLDAAEQLVYANHEFFTFTRLHPKQVLGRTIAQIIGQDGYGRYQPARERLARFEAAQWEGWIPLAGVGQRWMREHLIPCLLVDGTRGTIVISLDMTALKDREAELSAKVLELQTTEALKSAIVDHALAAIITADARGRIVEFNPAAEAMFGVPRAQAVGRPAAELVPQRFRSHHEHQMGALAAGFQPANLGRRLERMAIKADGTEFPVEVVAWRTEAAGRVFFTASVTDHTERRAAQQEIERQREALRQSEKLTAMGSLLAGVAHELNNPLAIVMGRASLLHEQLQGTALAADAQRVHDAAERCGRIVRTFLNLARQKPAERGPVALNALVTAAQQMLQYGLRSHGIALQLELDESLPSVRADGDQVGQVVLNLLVNAQQALAAQDGARHIRLVTGRTGTGADAAVWLRVHDNGPGVDPAVGARVFEPFFTTKPEGIGTGLGLAVSRTIAREHGGDLRLLPADHGACFELSLPLAGPDAAGAEPSAPMAAPPAEPRPTHVLVVDDEPEIAELMQAFLAAEKLRVTVATSGRDALAIIDRDADIDAVVSDLRMPDMDGAALWRAVRERHPALAQRMLFVTGDTLSPGAGTFLREAGCASLDKPFTRAALVARLREVLAGS
ncbi:MAG: PAS domain S-box protein [Aquabacterium sp.]